MPTNAKPHKESAPSEREQELQRKYMQYQLYKQQLNALVEEKNAIQERLGELNSTIKALEKLDSVTGGSGMWSTLGSGTFVQGDIKDPEHVLIAVGAGIVMKQTRVQGIAILKKRFDMLHQADTELGTEITKFATQAERLEAQLKHAVENEQ